MNAHALTTVARVKEFIGGSFTTAQETQLERLIDSVTDYIEGFCGRRFKKTTYTQEVYDMSGGEYLVLKNYPVSSVTLYYRNSALNENDFSAVDSETYFVNSDSGVIRLANNSKFGNHVSGGVAVTYTAGYDFDNVTTFLSNYAADLEFAVWKMVEAGYNHHSSTGVQSESIGDYSVTYSKLAFTDNEVKSILERYRKVEVGGISSPLNY